jgi:hypothetical protein
MATIHPHVTVTHEQIAAFCQKWNITQFELFGSVLRDDFRPDSDVDVLVSFVAGAKHPLRDLLEMERELRSLFGHPVDLVKRKLVEENPNYITRNNILKSARRVYAV